MESFTVELQDGWNRLSSLLDADATFLGQYIWTMLAVRSLSGSGDAVIKSHSISEPATVSGLSLAAGEGFAWDGGTQGIIDGSAIWINSSGGGDMDITFIRKAGVN